MSDAVKGIKLSSFLSQLMISSDKSISACINWEALAKESVWVLEIRVCKKEALVFEVSGSSICIVPISGGSGSEEVERFCGLFEFLVKLVH